MLVNRKYILDEFISCQRFKNWHYEFRKFVGRNVQSRQKSLCNLAIQQLPQIYFYQISELSSL